MEIWYIPLTVIPGAGLLIMSTTNLQTAISNELTQLIQEDCHKFRRIIELKITQLDLLNKALVALYFATACFILSALIIEMSETSRLINVSYNKLSTYLGVFSLFIALILLSIFSIRGIKIKKERFRASL
ncbi:MAG: hypothetical protein NW226_20750 [Microscillaceae bacterium]|nr:hypothetical protein [Microscillaceae bacterium]